MDILLPKYLEYCTWSIICTGLFQDQMTKLADGFIEVVVLKLEFMCDYFLISL